MSATSKISVAVASGAGSTLSVTSVSTPNVPCAPVSSLARSRPVTFFSTRPPLRSTSPSPVTKRMPRTWSRVAPQATRRGPERFAPTMPPKVAGRASPHSHARSGGSAIRCWPFSASAASISAIGVPARAEITSSVGRYNVMPVSARVESVRAAWTGRSIPRLVPLPSTANGSRAAWAARTSSATPSSVGGAFTRRSWGCPPAGRPWPC